MSELKPCPFCGSSAHTEFLNERHPDLYTVRCDNGGCFANKMGFGWKVGLVDIVAAWNTRSTPDLSAVREKLEAIRGLLVSDTWTRLHESMPDEDISNEQTAEYLDSQRDGLESKVYKLATAALALLEGGSNAS